MRLVIIKGLQTINKITRWEEKLMQRKEMKYIVYLMIIQKTNKKKIPPGCQNRAVDRLEEIVSHPRERLCRQAWSHYKSTIYNSNNKWPETSKFQTHILDLYDGTKDLVNHCRFLGPISPFSRCLMKWFTDLSLQHLGWQHGTSMKC